MCVFHCQPTALLLASGSAQGGQKALSVVYFRITHHQGRPHYVWDEYLFSVLQEVEVTVTVFVTVCVVWDDDERKGEDETRCRLIVCSSRKAPRGPPIRRTNRYEQYYMPSQHTYCGRVWNLIQDCDVQSSDQKVYIFTPPSPQVENFEMKIYYPAGDRTPDLLNQKQTCYHLSQCGERKYNLIYFSELIC